MVRFIDEEVTGEWFWSSSGNVSPFEMGPGRTGREEMERVHIVNFTLKAVVCEIM